VSARPNIFDPAFEPDDEHAGFLRRRYFVGRDAGAERLGATLFELPPGRTASPYHWHHANEEMLVVVAGRPSLRTPEGWRELAAGEVVSFPVGERGAHQVSNFADEPARYLFISQMIGPEVAVYPDSDKIGVREQAPGPRASGLWQLHRSSEAVDYWDGETPP
jgi:uncharacterized cupin superfamily protein